MSFLFFYSCCGVILHRKPKDWTCKVCMAGTQTSASWYPGLCSSLTIHLSRFWPSANFHSLSLSLLPGLLPRLPGSFCIWLFIYLSVCLSIYLSVYLPFLSRATISPCMWLSSSSQEGHRIDRPTNIWEDRGFAPSNAIPNLLHELVLLPFNKECVRPCASILRRAVNLFWLGWKRLR